MLVVYDKKRIAVSFKNSYLFIKQQPIHKLFKGCAGVAMCLQDGVWGTFGRIWVIRGPYGAASERGRTV